MLKKIGWGVLAVVVLLAAGAFYFRQDIAEIRAVMAYADAFKPENIDQKFRSLYVEYPSISVEAPEETYQLPRQYQASPMPATFMYKGEAASTADYILDSHTTGLAIMHNGKLIHEYYDRGNSAETHAIQMSVSKSMASILVGVAMDEGYIDSVEDQVVKYVPELKGTAYDGVRLKDVLEMSSGVRWNENYADLNSDIVQSVVAILLGSQDEFTKDVPRELEPGTYNRYSSIDTHVVGWVLRGATGKPYQEWFNEKLWSKIGAESSAELMVDQAGQPVVFGGVNIRLRDMLRVGMVLARGGTNHKGERIVSEKWIKTSVTPDEPRLMPGYDNPQSPSPLGYKYQWWLPLESDHGDFTAIGIHGQFLYINPARNVVIAKTSTYPSYQRDKEMVKMKSIALFQSIARHLTKQETVELESQ
ncbi:serine hydrolase [Pseudovibrio sp. JE062]|uniref:serine hydrolase domain-containing protein n=1 Tax=Pseudovibrio sp. JE062 TaxID=439495 RepID=UPI000186BA6E|nr:serine hydrolase [Pseudovibrio sp. JE062]EEA94725.1 beta-lactamase [Pseudovibrio sp. JE062]